MEISDEEPEVIGGNAPIVVDVRRTGSTSYRSGRVSQRSKSRSGEDDYISTEEDWSDEHDDHEDIDDEDDVDDEEVEVVNVTDSARQRNWRSKNGKRAVNMTPPDELLKNTEKIARTCIKQGKADRAIQELVRCVALSRIVFGGTHWRLAGAHAKLAETYFDLKAYAPQAEFHSQNARDILLKEAQTTSSEKEKADVYGVMFKTFFTMGRAQTVLKKYPEAETSLNHANNMFRERRQLSCVTDRECDDMELKLSHAMARLYWKQKKYAVAGNQFDKVVKLTRQRYGEDSPELIPVYQESGQLEQSKGKYADHEKAIDMFLQAHSIAGANYREGSVVLVDTALALAHAYACTGREEAESSAEQYLNECVAICTTHRDYGPHHTKTLMVQDELARLLIRTDRHDEALELLRTSIDSKCEVYGDYSESVSDTHKLLGSVHLSQGSIEKALREYNKCHNIQCLVLGKSHKKTKDTEKTIEILMATPGLSKKFVLSKGADLQNRPRFNAIVEKGIPGLKK